MSRQGQVDIIAMSAFERPDARLVVAAANAGAIALLDLGRDAASALDAMDDVRRAVGAGSWGVRVPVGCPVAAAAVPDSARVVLLASWANAADLDAWRGPQRRSTWVEVGCADDARRAERDGADAIVIRGNEAGGPVSADPAFVLLQAVADATTLPIHVAGGIGPHTAAAAVVGGASGVVVDVQLALLPEADVPASLRSIIAAMDGSESVVIGGHRVLSRPRTLAAGMAADTPADTVRALLGVDDPATQLLPIGPDGALAAGFARRWPTVAAAVRGLRASVVDAVRLAAAQRALTDAGPFAHAHGVRLPVVQGPMTRVSDTPAFAAAVADAGGLPFVALSEKRGAQCRALLAETAELLGDRPWGAGILGFLDPQLRDEQLEALTAVRPPFAVVAGGRPAQARALEDAGIATFLHVPSPGLLEQFLRDGARRFVFEGLECGGHVGPRSSFVLWSSQLEVLLQSGHAGEVDVLFAGGIHDARSAAMVAAAAAELVARGARIGVLLGTAYLFTEEIVTTGAVTPGYQAQALACTSTALLETSPGHATRCASTPYVAAFGDEQRRLVAQGLDTATMWAELELLNLGRLRIASKGLRRDGDRLVPVDADEQLSSGMYMLGQVAALRGETTTVPALHDDVTTGATAALAAVAERLDVGGRGRRPRPVEIAVVGMAAVLPGAADVDAFWTNVVTGVDAVTEVPSTRWDADIFFDPAATGASAGDMTPSKWGGFVPPVAFDALAHGIPPRSLGSIEPVQLLALHVAAAALDDSGYGVAGRPLDRARVAVLFGAEAGTDLSAAYGLRATARQYLGDLPQDVDASLPRLTEDSFPGILTNVIAGRVANRLDLGGPNFTVDAACASSLAALDAGVKELLAGTSDVALVGGADLHNGVNDYLLFASVHALSPTGRCAPFDAAADGIALGEGVGCVVLKRLDDARRDGDRVYAVLEGVGAASDGRSLGLTAPRPEGQRLAIDRAYAQAGVTPADIGLVEAHGTGTVVGDRTELAVLEQAFDAAGAAGAQTALGSVKSQVGHTKCTAGLAGFIKAVRAVHAGVLPPTIHLESPNPGWVRDTSCFRFHTAARPWPAEQRRAAVSAFGFGGTNFHAVLRAPDAVGGRPDHGMAVWPAELFCLRGTTAEQVRTLAARLSAYAESVDTVSAGSGLLRDLAAATWRDGAGPVRAAFVAHDLAELRERLRDLRVADDPVAPAPVAMLFPGQGSQRPQMLAQLFVAFPWLQRHLVGGADLVDVIYPPAAFDDETRAAQVAALTDTRVAQPALGMVELAVADLLARLGVRPTWSGGHSYGELSALAVAGALPAEHLVAVSRARAGAIVDAVGDDAGRMVAVAASAAEVQELVADLAGIVVANDNSPAQVVISGPSDAVAVAVERLRAAKVNARPLTVACAFHSPLVVGAAARFALALADVELRAPRHQVWSNATAAPYADAGADADVARLLCAQVESPVRFREQVESMYAAGARVFVEAGPGRVLTNLVGAVLGDRPHTAVAVDASGRGEVTDLLNALARLVMCGVDVDLAPLFAGRAREVDLTTSPPAAPGWLVDGHLVRTRDGVPVDGGLRPAQRPAAGVAAPAAAVDPRTEAVLAYLRTIREAVAAGRDALLGYLGAPPAPALGPSLPVAATPTADVPALPAVPVPGQRVAAEDAEWTVERINALVVDTIATRTGYPHEMLAGELDLEADLSIDSIKRLEIVGELAVRLELTDADSADDAIVEQLVGIKRIAGIAQWLHEAASARRPAAEPATGSHDGPPDARPGQAQRFVPRLLELPVTDDPVEPDALLRRRVRVQGADGAFAEAVRATLAAAGADVVEDSGDIDDVVHLVADAPGPGDAARALLAAAQEVLRCNASRMIVVTRIDGCLGADAPASRAAVGFGGVRGLVKSLRRELTTMDIRLVDVDPVLAASDAGVAVVAEMCTAADEAEVGRTRDRRHVATVVSEPLPSGLDVTPPFAPDDVVLLTGGARGVTAAVARWLALSGCRLELVGRTALTEPDRPELQAAGDAVALRRLLAGEGAGTPAEIESTVARVLAEREVRQTVAELQRLGATVRYHRLDVRDEPALRDLVARLYAEHGRIDAFFHGAGVIEDARASDKTDASFRRVFDTKAAAARVVLELLRPEVRHVVLFGSVAGLIGNAGQCDYAAANDALAALGRAATARVRGRVVTIDWGPWGGGAGMVSPELGRELERRGLLLLDPDQAVAALAHELRSGVDEAEVAIVATVAAADGSPFESTAVGVAGSGTGRSARR